MKTSRLDHNFKLMEALDNNENFSYAHLVKFQRVKRDENDETFIDSSANFGHFTDSAVEITYDDESTYLDENQKLQIKITFIK